jgi:hypothetical protein
LGRAIVGKGRNFKGNLPVVWYGHVKRMPEERISKLIMEWIPEERRKRGCLRKTWLEGVQAAMTARNLELDQWRNRNGIWFPEDGNSCYKTGWMDRSIDR